MASLEDAGEREIAMLPDLAADVGIVHSNVLVAGGSECSAVWIVDRKTDRLPSHVIADIVPIACWLAGQLRTGAYLRNEQHNEPYRSATRTPLLNRYARLSVSPSRTGSPAVIMVNRRYTSPQQGPLTAVKRTIDIATTLGIINRRSDRLLHRHII